MTTRAGKAEREESCRESIVYAGCRLIECQRLKGHAGVHISAGLISADGIEFAFSWQKTVKPDSLKDGEG